MWTSKILKERFFGFFEKRQHKILPGISVIPPNDPTLLFTNSGMVQFKDYFLGETAPHQRVCTSQRCIRAGGKHNDLDDVGFDNYHHTFFEMLGNWSFGDYFKEEAIQFAYDFLVTELGLSKDRLYVTIYEEMDKDSRRIWGKYMDDARIISASAKDNFWEMGEFGPCGPCTEIHYDRVGGRDASGLVNRDDPDVIEIWNIVFMEFNRTPSGLFELATKNIDTGIGFERLLSILMNVKSNYQIDTFQEIIGQIEKRAFCNKGYTFADGKELEDVAVRVIADHARTMAVCLHDKVRFSSDGPGYVLRRILRRAVRYAQQILCLEKGALGQIVGHAASVMELAVDTKLIDDEEDMFMKTLSKGSIQFERIVSQKGFLDGADVFLLYDTYGFPKDLTEVLGREKNVPVDLVGFEECRAQAQEQSRGTKSVITIHFPFDKTDDQYKYVTNGIAAEIKASVYNNEIIGEDRAMKVDDLFGLVFDKTCFYAEKGGQIGDQGQIVFFDDEDSSVGEFDVQDTQCVRGYVIHFGHLKGLITKTATLTFNEKLRALTRANHSTCHILYYFLRKSFKTSQQGSLVDSEKCRFDFDGDKLSIEAIEEVENKMNELIASDARRRTDVIPYEEALQDKSLHLEDGDYSSGVRVISFSNEKECVRDPCGGTHVSSTSEIERVRIISENGIQAHVRRIVAITKGKAKEADENAERLLKDLSQGRLVNTDCLLPITQRGIIEGLNKALAKKQKKEIAERTNSIISDLQQRMLSHRIDKLLATGVFSYVVTVSGLFSKKDTARLLSSLAVNLSKEKTTGFIILERDAESFVAVHSKDANETVLAKLAATFNSGNFRLAGDVVVGTVSGLGLALQLEGLLK